MGYLIAFGTELIITMEFCFLVANVYDNLKLNITRSYNIQAILNMLIL
jgi:hypothetical protein